MKARFLIPVFKKLMVPDESDAVCNASVPLLEVHWLRLRIRAPTEFQPPPQLPQVLQRIPFITPHPSRFSGALLRAVPGQDPSPNWHLTQFKVRVPKSASH